MKSTAATIIAEVVLALALVHASACATAQPATKSPAPLDDRASCAALVKELDALIAQGPLHFETHTDALTGDSQVLLQKIAAQMHRVARVRVAVGGHCDERGDDAYNLALG